MLCRSGQGLRLPLQADKGYSLTLPSPPQWPRTSAILSEAHVAVTLLAEQLAGERPAIPIDALSPDRHG